MKLDSLVNKQGVFNIAAMDHRGSLRKMLGDDQEAVFEVKRELVEAFSDLASAVLLDPDYGLKLIKDIPGNKGLLLALEKSDYDKIKPEIKEDWGVEQVKEHGGAAKLLLYCKKGVWHEELIKRVSDECRKEEIVFLLEPVLYEDRNIEVAWEMVKRYSKWVDVLKLEYPGSEEGCRKISEAAEVPWVLLSRGMKFENYKQALEIACKAGASGFAVGRAVWQEAMGLSRDQRKEFLKTTGRERFKKLIKIANSFGKKIEL